jgi:hypothetical protein
MRYAILTVLSAAMISPVVGCDKEVSHSESQTQNPVTGTTTTKDQTTYQRPDGSTYTQSSKTTNNNPSNNP